MANLAIGGTVHSAVFGGVRQNTASGGKEVPLTTREVGALAPNGNEALQSGKTGGHDEHPRAVDQAERTSSAFPSAEHLFESKGTKATSSDEALGLEPLPPLPLMELARARYEALMETTSNDSKAPVESETSEEVQAEQKAVQNEAANEPPVEVSEDQSAIPEPGANETAEAEKPAKPPPDKEFISQSANEAPPPRADIPPAPEEKPAA